METDLKTAILGAVDDFAEPCLEFVKRIEFQPGGILPSEALLLLCLLRAQDPAGMLESGRHWGYSTDVLLMHCCAFGLQMVSVDVDPIAAHDRRLNEKYALVGKEPPAVQRLEKGTADAVLPGAAKKMKRVGLFLDGPKGAAALGLFDRMKDHVAFCAIHDMSVQSYGKDGGQPNGARVAAEKLPAVWFSDDPEYTERFKHLDEPAWKKDYRSREEMVAYGFTLAVIPGSKWK